MEVLPSNDSALTSWVEVAPKSDFPIQNLPFGIFKTATHPPRAGVAIGEYILDLDFLQEQGYFKHLNLPTGIFNNAYLNDFFSLGKKKIREVRERVSVLLRHDNTELRDDLRSGNSSIIHQREVEMLMPVKVSNYTDFYSSEEHATNVGSMFRDPKNALLPNWKHLPVAYHGRASSIVVSGTPIRRPKGQLKSPDSPLPIFGPSKKLDFELELAFVTCGETNLGNSINVEDADKYIAGFVLFNDWSARDIQQWEYVPLGPFLGKNFGSSISPWIVTMDALEPFRVSGPVQDPPVLPYLSFSGNKNFDIQLEVLIQNGDDKETSISRSNFKYMYWNVNQQLAHHTVNGCNVEVGDMYASGTISGPAPDSFGSMLELSWNGQRPLTLNDGTTRTFLQDEDTVIMRGYAERNGIRIGFGVCSGKVLSSL